MRQLMKEVKSSLGSAVKILRGNMVIKLEMILEMPTASESSISILRMQTIKCDFWPEQDQFPLFRVRLRLHRGHFPVYPLVTEVWKRT